MSNEKAIYVMVDYVLHDPELGEYGVLVAHTEKSTCLQGFGGKISKVCAIKMAADRVRKIDSSMQDAEAVFVDLNLDKGKARCAPIDALYSAINDAMQDSNRHFFIGRVE